MILALGRQDADVFCIGVRKQHRRRKQVTKHFFSLFTFLVLRPKMPPCGQRGATLRLQMAHANGVKFQSSSHSYLTSQLNKTKTAGTQECDNAAVKQFRIIWLGLFSSLGRDMVNWSSLLGALQVRGIIMDNHTWQAEGYLQAFVTKFEIDLRTCKTFQLMVKAITAKNLEQHGY